MRLLEGKKHVLIPCATLLIVGGGIGLSSIKSPSRSQNMMQTFSYDTLEKYKGSENFDAIERELKTLRLQIETLTKLASKPIDKKVVKSLPTDETQFQTVEDLPIEERFEPEYEAMRDAQLMVMTEIFESDEQDVSTSIEIEERIVDASFSGEIQGIEYVSVACVSTLCKVDIDFKEGELVSPDDVLSMLPFVGEVFATGNDEQVSLFVAREGNPLPVSFTPMRN